ncbi:pyrroline-5-carboxylate reductase family protein [Pseudomonas sp. NPDC089569]|uniref:pyrroline-5-carboxylate reductase family protein n=1 Tax=Pseudomonas sp. NPDC089569 TaxID=3390722 RepID=UPI003D02D6DB
MQNLGILGVGDITEKTVRGLRRSGFDKSILLSPRNHERAAQLAADCDCQVMANNQKVVDSADWLIIGVRPGDLPGLAAELVIPAGKTIVSLAAGVSLDALQRHFPTARCIRAMLSGAAQFNQSTVVICPPDSTCEQLLLALGKIVVFQDEPDFELATVAACMNGWFYFFLYDLQQWLVEKGLPSDSARGLVLGNMQDCIATARHHPAIDLKTLGQAIATPGTYTADGLEMLNHLQANAHWGAACEIVLEALMTNSISPSNF